MHITTTYVIYLFICEDSLTEALFINYAFHLVGGGQHFHTLVFDQSQGVNGKSHPDFYLLPIINQGSLRPKALFATEQCQPPSHISQVRTTFGWC